MCFSGNAYAQPEMLGAPLVSIGETGYTTLESLVEVGFEVLDGNTTGASFVYPLDVTRRLQELPGPTYYADPATGDTEADATEPLANGDRIDGKWKITVWLHLRCLTFCFKGVENVWTSMASRWM